MKNLRLRQASASVLSVALVLSVLCVLCCACTVTPRTIKDSGASFDGNDRNSGFIAYAPDGAGIITPRARGRYNGLVANYGTRFSPPLKLDDGLRATTTNTFLIDAEHLVDFGVMTGWRRSGQKP
jgi:hypothetical protein